ncbi:hypothetical protein VL20_5631 [Microcystis panniformis FACHB-1757]|uniref:Uncharacterized protein n=1 Tax=Microcystis panniformis FACHB-1757 TaxID=1638788 RepID=A0A0K1S8Y2_9CHRO|nr:hypothetical protein VL20_5631 [Microcystis panniformis FACHB-1757]
MGARKATKPLPCLHFTFIQQALFKETKISNLCTKNSEPVLLEAKRTNQANLIKLFIF